MELNAVHIEIILLLYRSMILKNKLYKIRPKPFCFGIASLISDNNQGELYRKPHNKITQFGVWAFNTVKRTAQLQTKKSKEQTNRVCWINSTINKDNIINNVAADRNSDPRPISFAL